MSGYQPERIDAAILDTVQFIAKPFLPRALVQRVNEILGNTDLCVLQDEESDQAVVRDFTSGLIADLDGATIRYS
jgi:hypothetical protein